MGLLMFVLRFSRSLRTGLVSGASLVVVLGQAMASEFDIYEYRVEGNSLMSVQAIEQAVSAHMGEGRSLKDVEAARASLEKRYHDAGYLTVLVSIPEQQVDSGVVDLLVTEAPVSRLRVVGSQYHLPSTIKENLVEVSEGKVPNFVALQQRLGEVNKSGDLKVAPVLKPGKVPGTVEVQLDVDDQLPLHGGIEVTDRQAMNTTKTRLNASMRYDNLWQQGHSLGLSAQMSPEAPGETQVVGLNYMWPLSVAGDALTLYAVSSRSQFATIHNSPGLGVLGNAQIVGARYSFGLESAKDYVQSFTLGVDHKNIRQSLNLSGLVAPTPAVKYMPLSMAYKGVWPTEQGLATTLDINAIIGMRGLFGNDDQSFDAKRAGASANFLALRSTFNHVQPVGDWTLTSRLEWQLSSGALLPSEQYVAGGADTVRGYFDGERTGDKAVRFSFEMGSPSIKLGDFGGTWRANGLAFVDEALLQTHGTGAGQQSKNGIAGAGVGLRVNGPDGVTLSVDAARALTDGDVAGGGTRRGQWRMHTRLSVEF